MGLKENLMVKEVQKLPLDGLRQEWVNAWQIKVNTRMGRNMLEKSLIFKKQCVLTGEQETRLEQLVKQYKRNQKCFDDKYNYLKAGTKLFRNWKGENHSVLVKETGFEYKGKSYTSLSQVANYITGSRWNGRVFFGLKQETKS